MPDFERKKHLRLLGLWDSEAGGGSAPPGTEFAFRLTDSASPTGHPVALLVTADGDYSVQYVDTSFYTQTADAGIAENDDIQTIPGTGGVVSNAFSGQIFSLVAGQYIILYSSYESTCTVEVNGVQYVVDNETGPWNG